MPDDNPQREERTKEFDLRLERERWKRTHNSRWVITFVIWGAGAFGIWLLWEAQKRIPGTVGEIAAIAIQAGAFFYALALGPIRDWVGRWLGDH